jgi:hypothetical protein
MKYPQARTYDIIRDIKALQKATKALAVGPPAQPFGSSITYAATAPLNPIIGDIWYNTSEGNVASQWTGIGYDTTIGGLAPIAWWKLADTLGSTVALDASGFTHTGVATNVVYGQSGPVLNDTTAAFNGTSSTITTTYDPGPFSAFSVEAWVDLNGLTQAGNSKLVANSRSDTDHNGFELFLNGGTTPRITVGTGSTSVSVTGDVIPGTGWTYIAAVWDGSTLWLYQNGEPIGSTPFAGPMTAGSASGIGMGYGVTYSGDYLNGNLAEVAVYSTALSAAQVLANYQEAPANGWVPYQVGTGAIAPHAVTASMLGYLGLLNANPYFLGGDATGWSAINGTFAVVTPPTGIPFSYAGQYVNNGVTAGYMNEDNQAFPVILNQEYAVSAWVYTTTGDVVLGFDWLLSTGGVSSSSNQEFTIPVNTWTQITTVQTLTDLNAVSGAPTVGSNDLGGTTYACAILCFPQVPGSLIQAGTVTALQIIAGTIVGGIVDGTGINAQSMSLNPGPLLMYGQAGQTFVTLSGAGNWTCPAGVTSVSVFAQAAGGGINSNYNCGAGGGESAGDPSVAVTPTNLYAYSVPTGGTGNGGNCTFAGDTVTVTAHGGGQANVSGVPGLAGTGSTNAWHYNGGKGGYGHGSATGGGGGGGGAGISGSGAPGGAAVGAVGGQGGKGGPGFWIGGYGGNGGANGAVGLAGNNYGGGAGGDGSGIHTALAGGNGRLNLVYATSGSVGLALSMASASGIDPITSQGYPAGFKAYDLTFGASINHNADNIGFSNVTHVTTLAINGGLQHLAETAPDGNLYSIEVLHLWTSGTQTINSTTPAVITGLSATLAALSYRIRGCINYVGNQSAGTPTFAIHGGAVSLASVDAEFTNTDGAATQPIPYWNSGSLGSYAGAPLVNGNSVKLEFEIFATFSASALFTIQTSTSVATDTFTIQAGSWMDIMPV